MCGVGQFCFCCIDGGTQVVAEGEALWVPPGTLALLCAVPPQGTPNKDTNKLEVPPVEAHSVVLQFAVFSPAFMKTIPMASQLMMQHFFETGWAKYPESEMRTPCKKVFSEIMRSAARP